MSNIKDVKNGMLIFWKILAEIWIEDPRKNIVLLKHNPKNKIGVIISQKNVKYKDYFWREQDEIKTKIKLNQTYFKKHYKKEALKLQKIFLKKIKYD